MRAVGFSESDQQPSDVLQQSGVVLVVVVVGGC